MTHACRLALVTILVSSLPAFADHGFIYDSMALHGPESQLQPTPSTTPEPQSAMVAQPTSYHGMGAYGNRADCGCGEYFGGFGPLWANYCFEGRGCGWRGCCGPTCGAANCCGPSCGAARMRSLRWRHAAGCMHCGKASVSQKGCGCGTPVSTAPSTSPNDIGTPPELAPTPEPPALEEEQPAPPADAEAALPNHSSRRRWQRG